MVRHERNVCLLTSDQEQDNDPELSTEGNESPYSITDLFRSYVGKSSDILNNNIYSSFDDDGSNDTVENHKDMSGCAVVSSGRAGGQPTVDHHSQPASSLHIDGDGGNSTQQESSNASSSSSSQSPWEDTGGRESLERISNHPPGMMQLHRLLEVRGWVGGHSACVCVCVSGCDVCVCVCVCAY